MIGAVFFSTERDRENRNAGKNKQKKAMGLEKRTASTILFSLIFISAYRKHFRNRCDKA